MDYYGRESTLVIEDRAYAVNGFFDLLITFQVKFS